MIDGSAALLYSYFVYFIYFIFGEGAGTVMSVQNPQRNDCMIDAMVYNIHFRTPAGREVQVVSAGPPVGYRGPVCGTKR
jgi:hypothetical protein